MYIAEIHINSFRHLNNVHLGPLPRVSSTSELVVLAGPNGSGKSSILELLSAGYSNIWGYSYSNHRQAGDPSYEIKLGLSEADLAFLRGNAPDDLPPDRKEALESLFESPYFYVEYSFPNGEASKDTLRVAKRRVVSQLLRESVGGLFLKPDRNYPRRTYNRNQYFEWNRRMVPGYLKGVAFNQSDQQYTDQLEFLIEQAYNYPRTIGLYHQAKERGEKVEFPSDPMAPYESLLQRLFPGYHFSPGTDDMRDQLYITLPNGVEVAFSDLSSGEQEVFFLLSFFIRNGIRESVIMIDEPELHLHPELARRMVKIMLSIQPGNQIWLGTHNPDLLDEAGRDKTYFVTKNLAVGQMSVSRASDEPELVNLLRTIFGFSGYVGLARRFVFLEGDASSVDRRVFTSLFPNIAEEIRFVPLRSSDNISRMNRAVLGILEESLGYSEFYLIRDRDYLSPAIIARYQAEVGRNLFILNRHEIENYLLDATTISEVLEMLVNKHLTVDEVEKELIEECRLMAGDVLRDMVGARLNEVFQPHDCTIGAFGKSLEWIDGSGLWNISAVDAARERFCDKVKGASSIVLTNSSNEAVADVVASAQEAITKALSGSGWKSLFPGKELIKHFGLRHGVKEPILSNAVIRCLGANPSRIDHELREIVDAIVKEPTA